MIDYSNCLKGSILRPVKLLSRKGPQSRNPPLAYGSRFVADCGLLPVRPATTELRQPTALGRTARGPGSACSGDCAPAAGAGRYGVAQSTTIRE